MTRDQMILLATERGFKKLYPFEGGRHKAMRQCLNLGQLFQTQRNAVLMAWDRIAKTGNQIEGRGA